VPCLQLNTTVSENVSQVRQVRELAGEASFPLHDHSYAVGHNWILDTRIGDGMALEEAVWPLFVPESELRPAKLMTVCLACISKFVVPNLPCLFRVALEIVTSLRLVEAVGDLASWPC
jgi:hypothetical protein